MDAEAAYESAHLAAKKGFYFLEEARKSAAHSVSENEPLTSDEILLKGI
jgi:hypothetical protein